MTEENNSKDELIEKKEAELVKSSEKIEEKQLTKIDILKKLSSGTGLREALDDIVDGNNGALIVISNPNLGNVFEGGFKINAKFTSKRLVELAKMDGAIILSEDFKKILYANTLLTPSTSFSTIETGTRHQAAERAAKQIKGLVIVVSERRGQITIYYKNSRYVVQNTEELLRRATETLQILEKQRESLDELIINMNLLEINNLVSITDVCRILERISMIKKMRNIMNEYIVELGNEGIIVRMRMRELTSGIEKEENYIIQDYLPRTNKAKNFFEIVSFEKLLDLENMANVLFGKSLETEVTPKGYRILNKTSLSTDDIERLIKNFKNLGEIFRAEKDELKKILKGSVDKFIKEINTLREHTMIGKKI